MKHVLKLEYLLLLIVVLVCIPAVFPYFQAGYFPTHDGEWAVVRLGDMFRTIKDAQFPARYSGYLNFGYGYPLFNFAYPLPYYLGLILVFLKFGLVGSIKTLFILSVFFSAIAMFYASKTFWKNTWAGLISAILYIYFPYRFVDLYVRGSLGESLAFIVFPLIFYFLTKTTTSKKPLVYVVAASFIYAALIPTHNIMTVVFTPLLFVFIFCLVLFQNAKKWHFILFFAVSLGLSAFFWIPALGEKSNIVLSNIPIADRSLYFVNVSQLLTPHWGYGVPTDQDGFSYQIGWAQIGVFLSIGILLLLASSKKLIQDKTRLKFTAIFTVIVVGMVCMMFRPSIFLWENIPLLSDINYPWVLLSQIGFVVSFLAGFLAHQKLFLYIGLTLAGLSFCLTIPYARPSEYVNRGDEYYLTNQATTTSSDELMPVWVKEKPTEMYKQKLEVVKGNGNFENVVFDSNTIEAVVTNEAPSTIRINTIYYPGWNITVDSKPVEINYNNSLGVMDIAVSEGNHTIQGTFTETPLRLIADAISFLTLTGVGIFAGFQGIKKIVISLKI